MKSRNWSLNVTLPVTVASAVVAVVAWVLPVPGVLYGAMIVGAGYVTSKVAERRFARMTNERTE